MQRRMKEQYKDNLKEVDGNILSVEAFYTSLSVKVMEQSPKYPVSSWSGYF